MEKVLGILVVIFAVAVLTALVSFMVYDTITQDKIGTNSAMYKEVFQDCVVEVKGMSRNTSTLEDDDSSDIISECRYAALQVSRCVYNGKECI